MIILERQVFNSSPVRCFRPGNKHLLLIWTTGLQREQRYSHRASVPIKKCQVRYNTVMNAGWGTASATRAPLRLSCPGAAGSSRLTAVNLQPAAIILSYRGQKIQFQTTMWSTGETKAECAPRKWRHRRLNDFQVLGGQIGGPPFKAQTAIFLPLPQKMRLIFPNFSFSN